jgi:hypothetical protein
MTDWTSALHSMAGAILGAGAALTGQLIFAANARKTTLQQAQYDHKKWARDLAAQAHDGYIVEFERLTPYYADLEAPLADDWLTGLHLKLQRMRLVCSAESYQLAHHAMHLLEEFRTTDGVPWDPTQTAFDKYLSSARNDLGLIHHDSEPLRRRLLEHAHIHMGNQPSHPAPAGPPQDILSQDVLPSE